MHPGLPEQGADRAARLSRNHRDHTDRRRFGTGHRATGGGESLGPYGDPRRHRPPRPLQARHDSSMRLLEPPVRSPPRTNRPTIAYSSPTPLRSACTTWTWRSRPSGAWGKPFSVVINRSTATTIWPPCSAAPAGIPVLMRIAESREIAEAYARGSPSWTPFPPWDDRLDLLDATWKPVRPPGLPHEGTLELVVLSGKGGTGKTSLTAAFATFATTRRRRRLRRRRGQPPSALLVPRPARPGRSRGARSIHPPRTAPRAAAAPNCAGSAPSRKSTAGSRSPIARAAASVSNSVRPTRDRLDPAATGSWMVSDSRTGPIWSMPACDPAPRIRESSPPWCASSRASKPPSPSRDLPDRRTSRESDVRPSHRSPGPTPR